MTMKITRIVILMLVLLPSTLNALTLSSAERKCPFDGQVVKYQVMASFYRAGQYLDMQPYGSLLSPRPLPVCPNYNFVIFKTNFTKEELATYKKIIASKEYLDLAKEGHTSYYLLAKMLIEEDPMLAGNGWALLQATWQAKSSARYELYAKETIKYQKLFLTSLKVGDRSWINSHMIIGNLYRRLGAFEDAKEYFTILKSNSSVLGPLIKQLINYELALVESKDSNKRKVDEAESYEKTGEIPAAPKIE